MLLLMIDIVTVSFAQSALNKSHKRIKRRLLILTIADQGNLISPFYTGSQYTQHTLGIRRATVMLKCYGRFIFYCLAGLIRLAYFNVLEERRQQETDENRRYYQGLPITSMAIILPFLYLMRRYCGLYFLIVIHIAVIVVGLLFILNIKVKKPQNPVRVLLVAVVALALAKMFRLI